MARDVAVTTRPTLDTPPRYWVCIGWTPFGSIAQTLYDTIKEARRVKRLLNEQYN